MKDTKKTKEFMHGMNTWIFFLIPQMQQDKAQDLKNKKSCLAPIFLSF